MRRLLRAFRIPKVFLPTIAGAIAIVVSFMLTPTPEQVMNVNGVQVHTTTMNTVDYVILALRLAGGLALIVGVLAGFAYARGEMDVPHEALPPDEAQTKVSPETPPLNVPFSF